MDPSRLEGESFEEYKKRRTIVNKATKAYLQGKFVWLSKNIQDLAKGNYDTSWGTITNDKIKIVEDELLKIKKEENDKK